MSEEFIQEKSDLITDTYQKNGISKFGVSNLAGLSHTAVGVKASLMLLPTDVDALIASLISTDAGNILSKGVGACTVFLIATTAKAVYNEDQKNLRKQHNNIAHLLNECQIKNIHSSPNNYSHYKVAKILEPEDKEFSVNQIDSMQLSGILNQSFTSLRTRWYSRIEGEQKKLGINMSREEKNLIAIDTMKDIAELSQDHDLKRELEDFFCDDDLALDTIEASDLIIRVLDKVAPGMETFSTLLANEIRKDSVIKGLFESKPTTDKQFMQDMSKKFYSELPDSIARNSEQHVREQVGRVIHGAVKAISRNNIAESEVNSLILSVPDHVIINKYKSDSVTRMGFTSNICMELSRFLNSDKEKLSISGLCDCINKHLGTDKIKENDLLHDDCLSNIYSKSKESEFFIKNVSRENSISHGFLSRLSRDMVDLSDYFTKSGVVSDRLKSYLRDDSDLPIDQLDDSKMKRSVLNQLALDAIVSSTNQGKVTKDNEDIVNGIRKKNKSDFSIGG